MIRSTIVAVVVAVAASPVAASASQGPGAGPGTAAPWLQVAMAIAVYGGAAVIVAAGLVGALRQAR